MGEKLRASAQGLFMMMTNGLGTIFGALVSGIVIDKFFILENGNKDWSNIWLSFAAYALVIGVLFAVMFKHKHKSCDIKNVSH